MNNTFSPGRFVFVFRKLLLERPMQLIGLVVLTLAIVLITYSTVKGIWGYEDAQNFSFLLGLLGGGSFLASLVFGYFSSNAAGASFLTLPASHFEKWLSAILVTCILFPLLFLAFYKGIDAIFISLYHNSLNPADPFFKEKFEGVNTFSLKGFVAQKGYIMFANAVGAMLVGSLYFNKVAFIKVALLVCALFIGGHLLNYLMASAIFDSVDKALPYYAVFIPAGKEVGKLLLPDYASVAVDIAMQYVMPALFLIVAYVRLTDKEF